MTEVYSIAFQDHTKAELDDLKLVRVDERFRVIALGLPVPRYQGNPLDPPLRSRFQARDVHTIPFKVTSSFLHCKFCDYQKLNSHKFESIDVQY